MPDQLARVEGASPIPPKNLPFATIKDVRRELLADAVRITIELDHEVMFYDERIADPGLPVCVADTLMDDPASRRSVAETTLSFAAGLARGRPETEARH